MKNNELQMTNPKSLKSLLLLGGLISLSLLLLRQVNIFNFDLELVMAPFVVLTLLAYGDQLYVYLLLNPLKFAFTLSSKIKGFSQTKKNLTPKQS